MRMVTRLDLTRHHSLGFAPPCVRLATVASGELGCSAVTVTCLLDPSLSFNEKPGLEPLLLARLVATHNAYSSYSKPVHM